MFFISFPISIISISIIIIILSFSISLTTTISFPYILTKFHIISTFPFFISWFWAYAPHFTSLRNFKIVRLQLHGIILSTTICVCLLWFQHQRNKSIPVSINVTQKEYNVSTYDFLFSSNLYSPNFV